jgi:hypothetical protein
LETPKQITLPVAAVLLRMPYYTAHRLALRGALGPVQQIAGRWLLDADAVQAYIDQRAKSATGSPLLTGDGTESAVGDSPAPAT